MDDTFTLKIGTETRKFRLVRTWFCTNLAQVWDCLRSRYGAIPDPKWHQAFKNQWQDDGQSDPIAAVHPSREATPKGGDRLPYILKEGRAYWSNGGWMLDNSFRWLVMVI